jgi:hypothetical protein
MTPIEINTPARRAAIHGLAVVGFVTLIVLGISLAVYSARYVPGTVGRVGAAAVSLSQIFTGAPTPSLSVVPTASTTIPFDTASSTASTSAAQAISSASAPRPATPTAGAKTSGIYQLGGGASALSGLPDLTVTINAVGYLTATSTSSFVATTTVPYGENPAVKFTVKEYRHECRRSVALQCFHPDLLGFYLPVRSSTEPQPRRLHRIHARIQPAEPRRKPNHFGYRKLRSRGHGVKHE